MGLNIRGALLLFSIVCCFTELFGGNRIVKEEMGKDVFVISGSFKGQNFLSNKSNCLYQYKAESDGFIRLRAKNEIDHSHIVTIYNGSGKELITQGTTQRINELSEEFAFYSQKDSVYLIEWQLADSEEFDWVGKQEAVRGLSPASAICVSDGMLTADHNTEMEQWFVFTAQENSTVCISSAGFTNENTCLFVYKDPLGLSIASSKGIGADLQAEVVIQCKKGEKYYMKWSNAFTNKKYNWKISYV